MSQFFHSLESSLATWPWWYTATAVLAFYPLGMFAWRWVLKPSFRALRWIGEAIKPLPDGVSPDAKKREEAAPFTYHRPKPKARPRLRPSPDLARAMGLMEERLEAQFGNFKFAPFSMETLPDAKLSGCPTCGNYNPDGLCRFCEEAGRPGVYLTANKDLARKIKEAGPGEVVPLEVGGMTGAQEAPLNNAARRVEEAIDRYKRVALPLAPGEYRHFCPTCGEHNPDGFCRACAAKQATMEAKGNPYRFLEGVYCGDVSSLSERDRRR